MEEMVAYLVWFLASDHPKRTRFVYSRMDAVRLVPDVLGAQVPSGTENLRWSPTGNTLGVCVRYCQRLCEWLSQLQATERNARRRPTSEVHARPSDSVTTFVFQHDQLWADASPDALTALSERVADCVAKLNRADVTFVRNGLEHYREPERFPPIDRMLSSIEMLRAFVHQCEAERFVPKLFWIGGRQLDSFGQSTYDLVDFKGGAIQIHLPATVAGLLSMNELPRHSPVLVAPGNVFGLPNADVLFTIREQSTYSQYWSVYPALRQDPALADVDAPIRHDATSSQVPATTIPFSESEADAPATTT